MTTPKEKAIEYVDWNVGHNITRTLLSKALDIALEKQAKEYDYELEKQLDFHFPKGECKERGLALCMVGEMKIFIKKKYGVKK